MKTRTNQPVFYDNGQRVDDSKLGTKTYKYNIYGTCVDPSNNQYDIDMFFISKVKDLTLENWSDNFLEITIVALYRGGIEYKCLFPNENYNTDSYTCVDEDELSLQRIIIDDYNFTNIDMVQEL